MLQPEELETTEFDIRSERPRAIDHPEAEGQKQNATKETTTRVSTMADDDQFADADDNATLELYPSQNNHQGVDVDVEYQRAGLQGIHGQSQTGQYHQAGTSQPHQGQERTKRLKQQKAGKKRPSDASQSGVEGSLYGGVDGPGHGHSHGATRTLGTKRSKKQSKLAVGGSIKTSKTNPQYHTQYNHGTGVSSKEKAGHVVGKSSHPDRVAMKKKKTAAATTTGTTTTKKMIIVKTKSMIARKGKTKMTKKKGSSSMGTVSTVTNPKGVVRKVKKTTTATTTTKKKKAKKIAPLVLMDECGMVSPPDQTQWIVWRTSAVVCDQLRSGNWPEARAGARYQAAVSLDRFSRSVWLPYLLADGEERDPEKVWIATMITLRDVMVQNAASIFAGCSPSSSVSSSVSVSDDHVGVAKLYGTAVVLAAAAVQDVADHEQQQEQEKQQEGDTGEDDTHDGGETGDLSLLQPLQPSRRDLLEEALEAYDDGDPSFVECLERADETLVPVTPTGQKLDEAESVAWRCSYNTAQRRHPLMLPDDHDGLSVAEPTACMAFMVESVPDDLL